MVAVIGVDVSSSIATSGAGIALASVWMDRATATTWLGGRGQMLACPCERAMAAARQAMSAVPVSQRMACGKSEFGLCGARRRIGRMRNRRSDPNVR